MVRPITKNNFQKEVIDARTLSLVQFKAEWSGACHIIAPMYHELTKIYKGQVHFFYVDADTDKDLYKEFGIIELPTILFFKTGELVDHVVGITSKDKLVGKIETALASLNRLS